MKVFIFILNIKQAVISDVTSIHTHTHTRTHMHACTQTHTHTRLYTDNTTEIQDTTLFGTVCTMT